MNKILFGVLALLSAGLTAVLPAARIQVEIEDFAYVPGTVTVMEGDTVEWINRDGAGHSATSGSDGMPDGIWDSGILQTAESFSYVFAEEGTYPYFCSPHPFMTGQVIVEAMADTSDTTDVPAVEESIDVKALNLEVYPEYVQFSIPATTTISLGIYDLTGREIELIASGFYTEGIYEYDLPRFIPGMYFVRLSTVSENITRRFTQL